MENNSRHSLDISITINFLAIIPLNKEQEELTEDLRERERKRKEKKRNFQLVINKSSRVETSCAVLLLANTQQPRLIRNLFSRGRCKTGRYFARPDFTGSAVLRRDHARLDAPSRCFHRIAASNY